MRNIYPKLSNNLLPFFTWSGTVALGCDAITLPVSDCIAAYSIIRLFQLFLKLIFNPIPPFCSFAVLFPSGGQPTDSSYVLDSWLWY